ncbi:MAG TPA: transglycosylase domain-containing protein [Solirubrobacteraceae bacterium]|jgi:penicillin-binding protein 1A|nr:transglycosylase domain-containing protein [Solirubrobacteraceae bacterium]
MSAPVRPDIPPAPPPEPDDRGNAPKPRLKRLRLVAIVFAVLVLGLVSFVFGIFISVASDLPSLARFSTLKEARSSVLLDDLGHPIGVVSQQNRVIVTPSEIPQVVKEAVISIEDKRFKTNSGIDIRGIARAFVQDILHKGTVQGASTIEQQFIKNALQAQSHRTIFEKLREAALAFQLSHKWSKEKILTAYLNTIYFGNGAYGIEAAAQTYFGHDVNHLGCGMPSHELCVQQLKPWEAALLAGIIQSPTAYDPAEHPLAARERRDVVLRQMLEQGYLTKQVYEQSASQALPAAKDVQAPTEQTIEGVDAGYFTSWVQQQVIERYGASRAFDGGLKIKTTLDLELQRAAEHAVNAYLESPEGPTASLVAIENSTGEVRAMVGGRNYAETPFNLATNGERQPGSSFKAFDLAAALEAGISPESTWTSKQKVFIVPGTGGQEKFVVHNDEGNYTGSNTLTGATAYSDNSIYAEVGLKVGTKHIAHLAHEMGITTPLSTNPAMTIGGLTVGVTPLDMAHAYETIAHGGRHVSGTLANGGAPVAIQEVDGAGHTLPDGNHVDVNHVITKPVLPAGVAETETSMLETVLQYGTGKAAAIGQFAAGKTGTTSNYGDAWFVGWDHKYTVAVWVGYPNKLIPMTTNFNGTPVLGGTFPALIWHDFMTSALSIDKSRAEAAASKGKKNRSGEGEETSSTGGGETSAPPPAAGGGSGSSQGSPSGAGGSAGGGAKSSAPSGGGEGGSGEKGGAPEKSPAPSTPPAASPAPSPSAPAEASAPPSSSPTGGVSPGG